MFEISRRICCRTFCTRLGCARATTSRRGIGAPAARARATTVTTVTFARRDARARGVTDDERRAAETDARAVDGVGVENMTNGHGGRRVTRVRDAREDADVSRVVVDDRRIDGGAMVVVGGRRGALALARAVGDAAASMMNLNVTTTTTTTTTIGRARAMATTTTKTTTTKTPTKTTGKRATAGAKKKTSAKTKAGATTPKPKATPKAKKPPAGKLRTVLHASAAKFPLHESVLKDARGYRVRQYRMVESRRYDEAALATADAGARRSGKITLATAKAIVKSVEDGGARWGVTQTEIDTIRFVVNGGGGAYAYETQPAARKFLEEFAAKAEGQAAAAAAAAPSVVKAKSRVETFTPPPTTANRVMPHAAASKFPLHESILNASASTQAARTVLREPLSTPIASTSSSPPPPPPPPSQDGQGSSRTTILAAIGAVLAALLAYSMGDIDEEDRPPPPLRKKSPPARKDIEVEIEIVKQPDDAVATQTNKKPVQKKEKQTEKVEAKEVADAFDATADFLSKVEVRDACAH